jgi:hypothetical protein
MFQAGTLLYTLQIMRHGFRISKSGFRYTTGLLILQGFRICVRVSNKSGIPYLSKFPYPSGFLYESGFPYPSGFSL